MGVRHVYLQCSCQCPDHVIRVTLEMDDGQHPQLSIQPLLNAHRSFFRRLWVAFRYIFNRKGQGMYWGGWQFEDVILDDEAVMQLMSQLALYKIVVKRNKRRVECVKNKAGKSERPRDSL